MSKKPVLKIVLDTNVWISALLWGGKPASIIETAEKGKLRIFISEEIAVEISQVLAYPKIKKIFKTELRRQEMIEQVLKIAKFVKVTTKVEVVNEHPADNKFIECALAAKANFIVSGDKHLLKVVSYKKIQVSPVSDFLALLE